MGRITINKQKCKGCALCVDVCPNHLLEITDELNDSALNYVKFKDANNLCTGCASCALICPDCAIIEVYR